MTKTTNEPTWKDWTREDWDNASYCGNCGLPLLEVKADENAGGYICVYCEWTSDEADLQASRLSTLEAVVEERDNVNGKLRKALEYCVYAYGDAGASAVLAETAPKVQSEEANNGNAK